MTALKVLFIGGTGIISSACAARAVAAGMELTVLNRGKTSTRPLPEGAEVVQADIRDPDSVRAALGDREFDVVVDFVAFMPEHVQADIDAVPGPDRPVHLHQLRLGVPEAAGAAAHLESTPLRNPHWQYSRDKIACEELLVRAYRENGFPVTIVRPSHTYDRTAVPLDGGWTAVDRMRRGQPVVVHGDGTSLWTLTHHTDFAKGFVGLLGHTRGDRGQLPHHLRRGAHLEPDLTNWWRRPPGWSRGWCTSRPTPSPRDNPAWAPGCSATRHTR